MSRATIKEDLKSSNKNIFITAKPVSQKISKYISYYYFDRSNDENYQRKFIFYPNYKHALTAYKSSKVVLAENKSSVSPIDTNQINSFYSINKNKNIKVSIEGRYDKIGIVFNPLGINHFLIEPLQDIFPFDIDFFTYFGAALNQTLEEVFISTNIDKKVFLLDP